jgi:hypothetical protein
VIVCIANLGVGTAPRIQRHIDPSSTLLHVDDDEAVVKFAAVQQRIEEKPILSKRVGHEENLTVFLD